MRQRRIKTNPAAQVLLPAARPSKPRKSFTIEQAQRLLVDAIPSDSRPAMWLTGLMCGLRPGELAGLRWCFVDVDSDSPSIEVAERALEVEDRYVGQAAPKTPRSRRRIELHPLLVAALRRHRDGEPSKRWVTAAVEDMILLTRPEAWELLRVLERAVDAAEKAGREDAEASAAFRTVASKLLPDLFPDQ